MNYIYILQCEDNSLYTGVTKDLYHRMDAHYHGKKEGAKYTKSHKPKEIVMVWTTKEWSDACRLEYFIKTLSKSQKKEIVKNPKQLQILFRQKKEENDFCCEICNISQKYPVFLQDFLSNSISLC